MDIIIYGTCYGTARKYAEELSRRTGILAINHENLGDINDYHEIIYIGSLYAGGVVGVKKTFHKLRSCRNKKIIIITVGLADPCDHENVQNIRNGMKKQLPEEIYEAADIYHLRGGIDYATLGFKHKTMMAMLHKKASGLPEEKKTAEVRAMLETYNKKVDFIDFSCLDQIVKVSGIKRNNNKE